MRFFSKIVTLCNLAFIFVALYKLLKIGVVLQANKNAIQPTNVLIGAAAILFVISIFFSLVFTILVFIKRLRNLEIDVPPLLILFNLLMLPIQIWYFFFNN